MRLGLVALYIALPGLGACAVNPMIDGGSRYAVNTPDYYTENRVLFLGDADEVAPQTRALLHPFQLNQDTDDDVQRLRPLGVIVRGVRMPEDLQGRRDIAVILDVLTAGSENATEMVVFYQRDVPGGQLLNFQDLLVYYDPEWDGLTPPYFRVRVLEVNTERNARTREFLEEASKLPGALGGIAPHPLLPIVRTAIEAARLTLGNRRNRVIVDYQVQFYSRTQIEGAGSSVLSPLRKGEWLVVGRERDATSAFWSEPLQLDIQTGILHGAIPEDDAGTEATPRLVKAPYVAVVIISADAVVPKHIMDRSQALVTLLSSPTDRSDFDGIVNAIESLRSAGTAFRVEQRLKRYLSTEDFVEVIDLLKDYQSNEDELRVPQVRSLVRLIDDLVVGRSLGSVGDVLSWWSETGVAAGTLVEATDSKPAPRGWKWVASVSPSNGS